MTANRWMGMLVVVMLVTQNGLRADTVMLADGSRLVGTVKVLDQGKLVLATDFAGDLELDAAKITAIEMPDTAHVALGSGDTLVGTIVPAADGQGFVVQTQYANVPVQTADVNAVWRQGDENPEMKRLEAEIKRREEALWSSTLEAGGSIREGNTDTKDAYGRFELRRKTEKDLLKWYVRGNYGEADDVKTTAEVIGGMRYENNLTERLSWYTGVELEYDEFENLDLRMIVVGGLAYAWIKQERAELKTRAGLGYKHESYKGGDTVDAFIGDFGLNVWWQITDWLKFSHDTSYQPTWDDFADYRLVFDTAVQMPLGTSDMWSFKIGANNTYNNQPQPGRDRWDHLYYTAIVLDIK